MQICDIAEVSTEFIMMVRAGIKGA
jgi:hypothetical protein